MSEQNNVFTRIGQWFKGFRPDGNTIPVEQQPAEPLAGQPVETHRLSIFRPWARRDAAIVGLQHAFESLTDLMGTIRDNLEKQNQRQDEIISHLSRIPEALQSLPEAAHAQSQALKAIGDQLEQQVDQQNRLAEILTKVTEAGADQKDLLQSLHERAQEANQRNEAISDNLRQVGSAMADMGRNTESSAKVLQNVRECIDNRDTQFQQIIDRQNTRFTTLLIISISLATLALIAVAVVAFLLLRHQ
ncbi:MAG TPA: hypothetical protein VHP11_17675 [Tepidisphaeraceae bacterium]|nr:hypothetical protein [Tepidisphaeraceae bacterium]